MTKKMIAALMIVLMSLTLVVPTASAQEDNRTYLLCRNDVGHVSYTSHTFCRETKKWVVDLYARLFRENWRSPNRVTTQWFPVITLFPGHLDRSPNFTVLWSA